jgi:carboxymethylenebutenolidase
MCDESTEAADDAALARRGITRREFAALGAAVAVTGCVGMADAGEAGSTELKEGMVNITTADGMADAFFVHPVRGTHPGVVFWPDVGGLRDVKKIMARRLAAAGYAVLVVNPYYRDAPAPVLNSISEYRTPEGKAKVEPMRAKLTPDAVTRDAKAFVAFLDGDGAVDKRRKIGTQGYCMGGPFTVRTAAAVPTRVGAAASFHGGGLVGDAPDSPDKLLAKTQASFLFAIGRNDDAKALGDKDTLRRAADAAGRPAEIEVYAADHGWCVADAPVYDPTEADRAWDRLLALYAKL